MEVFPQWACRLQWQLVLEWANAIVTHRVFAAVDKVISNIWIMDQIQFEFNLKTHNHMVRHCNSPNVIRMRSESIFKTLVSDRLTPEPGALVFDQIQFPSQDLSFAHLWQQHETSDMDVILLAPEPAEESDQQEQEVDSGTPATHELMSFPAHKTLLSNSAVLWCRVSGTRDRHGTPPRPSALLPPHEWCPEGYCSLVTSLSPSCHVQLFGRYFPMYTAS
jgi:hypothetical protein